MKKRAIFALLGAVNLLDVNNLTACSTPGEVAGDSLRLNSRALLGASGFDVNSPRVIDSQFDIGIPLEVPKGSANEAPVSGLSIPVAPELPTFHFSAQQNREDAARWIEQGQRRITVVFRDEFGVRAKKGIFQLDDTNELPKEEYALLSQLERNSSVVVSPTVADADLSEDQARRIWGQAKSRAADDSFNPKSMIDFEFASTNSTGMLQAFDELARMTCVKRVIVQCIPSKSAAIYGTTPSDPFFPNQSTWAADDLNNPKLDEDVSPNNVQSWWYNRHSFAGAWTFNQGSSKVAVIDDCFQTAVPYDGVSWDTANGWNYALGISDVSPDYTPPVMHAGPHGSEVSYLIGAKANNGVGLCGGAPASTILPLAVQTTVTSQFVSAIYRASTISNVKVINMSYYFDETTASADVLRAAMTYAYNADVNVVFTAGNSGAVCNYDPAKFSGAVVVGGISKYNGPYYTISDGHSGYGSRVDIAAAAQYVSTATPTGFNWSTWKIKRLAGTSYAAPLVSSALAIVRAQGVNAQQARDIVIGTSDWGTAFAGGERPMPSHYGYGSSAYGSDGLSKIRILNAQAAARVASIGSSARCIYRPASSDYSQIKAVGGSWSYQDWHPANFLLTFSGPGTIEVWEYNSSATHGVSWAGSHAVYKNGLLQNYCSRGVPVHLDAQNAVITYPQNILSNGQQTGWVNGQYVAIP